jgi:sugar phosphate isomerase/epimerase
MLSRWKASFVTIHIGLGRNSTNGLHWDRTVESVAELVRFAERLGIRLCLENLAWGWTSRPELFERLIRKTGAGITLDLGHARMSPWVQSHHYHLEDFVFPHPEKIYNAHIYHEEGPSGHLPPKTLADIKSRLNLLKRLPCDWWVLELHNEKDLLTTLRVIQEYVSAQTL